MKRSKDTYALSAVNKPDLEDDQWFPKVPAKPATKWSLLISLLDEIVVILFAVVIIYIIINRF